MLEKFDREYEVCSCCDIELGTILDTIKEHNLTTVEDVMHHTEAGTACEQCQNSSKSGGDKDIHLDEIITSLQK